MRVARRLAGTLAPLADGPERRQPARIGIGRQRAQDQAYPADAVDQRVVHLDVDREAVLLESLDQVQLPQWAVQVELVAVQPRDEDAELALATRFRQCRVAHVVVEIEVVVLPHERQPGADDGPFDQLQIPGTRDRVLGAHALELLAQVVGRRVGRIGELEQPTDVHGRVAALENQPGRIDG